MEYTGKKASISLSESPEYLQYMKNVHIGVPIRRKVQYWCCHNAGYKGSEDDKDEEDNKDNKNEWAAPFRTNTRRIRISLPPNLAPLVNVPDYIYDVFCCIYRIDHFLK